MAIIRLEITDNEQVCAELAVKAALREELSVARSDPDLVEAYTSLLRKFGMTKADIEDYYAGEDLPEWYFGYLETVE